MRLIDAESLRGAMYHKSFETDTDLQRWDSGCWIRYKLFQETIDEEPTVDAVRVVRCRDCMYYEETWSGFPICRLTINGAKADGFCAWGERREDAEE